MCICPRGVTVSLPRANDFDLGATSVCVCTHTLTQARVYKNNCPGFICKSWSDHITTEGAVDLT